MADYDSDSSLDDAPYSETNVLLGYATTDPTDDTISHLGGTPVRPLPATEITTTRSRHGLTPRPRPRQPSPAAAPATPTRPCSSRLNGDLPERFPGHERRLYLFRRCRRKRLPAQGGLRAGPARRADQRGRPRRGGDACRGRRRRRQRAGKPRGAGGGETRPQRRALRRSRHPPLPRPRRAQNPFSTTPGSSTAARANPFGPAPAPASSLTAKPAQTPLPQSATQQPGLAETTSPPKARISSSHFSGDAIVVPAPPPRPHEPWPSPKEQPAPYARFSLDAEYETLSAPSAAPIPAAATLDESGEGSGGGNDREDKLLFESAMDKTFQAFADRLAHNPEQVLRYEFGGAPLLYSGDDAVGRRLPSRPAARGGARPAAAARGGAGSRRRRPAARTAAPRARSRRS